MQMPTGPVLLYPTGTILRTTPKTGSNYGYEMVVGKVGPQLFTQPVNHFTIASDGTISSDNTAKVEALREPKARITRFA